MNVEKNVWTCQSASCVRARGGKIGGNNLDLIVAMEGCSIYRAAVLLQMWFGAPTGQSSAGAGPVRRASPDQRATVEFDNRPLGFSLSGLDCQHQYLIKRGISTETARYFGAGFYSGRGIMSGSIVIPIHNRHGKLVAYAGRSIDGSLPKYRFPAGFRKSQELYNLHRVLTPAHGGRVIVVEGFFDCWQIYQAGFPCVITLMGCALSRVQSELLEDCFNQVILLLDGDLAGRTASENIGGRLAEKL